MDRVKLLAAPRLQMFWRRFTKSPFHRALGRRQPAACCFLVTSIIALNTITALYLWRDHRTPAPSTCTTTRCSIRMAYPLSSPSQHRDNPGGLLLKWAPHNYRLVLSHTSTRLQQSEEGACLSEVLQTMKRTRQWKRGTRTLFFFKSLDFFFFFFEPEASQARPDGSGDAH